MNMAESTSKGQNASGDFRFDPFGLHSVQEDGSSTSSPHPPPQVTRLTRQREQLEQTLPPREPTLTPDDVVEATKKYIHVSPSRTTPRSSPLSSPRSNARNASPASVPAATTALDPAASMQDNQKQIRTTATTKTSPTAPALPPRLVIKFTVHEEVSSVARSELEGTSDVYVEGNVSAQVTSSDALKNIPFCLLATTPDEDPIKYQPNQEFSYSLPAGSDALLPHAVALIKIPKAEIAAVPIGKYSISEVVPHMPLLLERKVTLFENTVRVALQVRSKLSNNGDLTDITIAVAIPERVNSETIQITRGDGVYDELKRTIKWSLEDLPKGESLMVSVNAELWSAATKEDQVLLRFPVVMRCSSNYDQISNVELKAEEAVGFPSSITCSQQFMFRLLHRLP